MSDVLLAAQADKAVEFSFPFRGATWLFVVRLTAKCCDAPRVDVFEDGVDVGIGYLGLDEGPMFDGSDKTPLGGKTLFTEDGEDIEMDDNHSAMDVWGELLGKHWDLIRAEYLSIVGDHEPEPSGCVYCGQPCSNPSAPKGFCSNTCSKSAGKL